MYYIVRTIREGTLYYYYFYTYDIRAYIGVAFKNEILITFIVLGCILFTHENIITRD